MRLHDHRTPLFEVGRVVITAAADAEIERIAQMRATDRETLVSSLVLRHQVGDWGATFEADQLKNESALGAAGGNIHSVYDVEKTIFWVITEADRSITTVLLPDDY